MPDLIDAIAEPTAWMNRHGYFTADPGQAAAHETMGTPLTSLYARAAMDEAISRAREVKPLVWEKAALMQRNMLLVCLAETASGRYEIYRDNDWFSAVFNDGDPFVVACPTLETAKAAAQADAQTRSDANLVPIHAALAPVEGAKA